MRGQGPRGSVRGGMAGSLRRSREGGNLAALQPMLGGALRAIQGNREPSRHWMRGSRLRGNDDAAYTGERGTLKHLDARFPPTRRPSVVPAKAGTSQPCSPAWGRYALHRGTGNPQTLDARFPPTRERRSSYAPRCAAHTRERRGFARGISRCRCRGLARSDCAPRSGALSKPDSTS